MRLARLKEMSVGELALRGRQEASKWLERLGPAPRPRAAAPGAGDRLAFFLTDAQHERVPALLDERLPGERAALEAAAEAILDGRFDLLGYRGLSFGRPLDWQLDPVSGRRAPCVHWSRIDPLDSAQVGDSKVAWELGRMQWLVTLGQAYRLTGSPRYAEAFAAHVRGFLQANPVGLGIHWTSSLECALRIVSWSWALALFAKAPVFRDGLAGEMAVSLAEHAIRVERYLSFTFSPNTHLTGEALGLLYAGLLLPGLGAAPRWRTLGLRLLAQESERQIYEDGIYFEQATAYQRYTAEIGLHLVLLAQRTGLAVPAVVRERVQRLLDALLWLRRPDGTLPAIGDADGGWLLPVTRRAGHDPRGVFGLAAALFGRRDYAWAAEGLVPEVAWLLGPAGAAAYDALEPAPPAARPSRLFGRGGYAVMASGWEREAHHLVLDAGPLGCPVSGAHGHADLLAIQCTAFGEPYVVDPGTYAYTASAPWRNFFRSSAAHATVVVDGREQAEPAGPFSWKRRPRAALRRWVSGDRFDLADGQHEAYRILPDPVVHRRRVLFVKPRYWVVMDELHGAAEHRIELRFPFAPRPVSAEPGPWVRALGGRDRGLLVRAFAAVPLALRIHCGETDPIQGWVSPDYGQREAAPVAVFSARAPLPLRVLTLLWPLEAAGTPPPAVSLVLDEEGGPCGLAFAGGEEVRFGAEEAAVRLASGAREEVCP